ncbi:MAG: hypothetical protein DA408_16325 [Bacteroidetes bacterium]|nr:MAG: hypothetical protein C7N36_01515 [Bacteroidota bacterium]PTM10287.1 MAG: hypothetical protein DA408_16325 [Bacteroidota bacterium]
MDQPLVNRVASSGLITLKLEEFFPPQPLVHFDLKDFLFMELILKEKDFREALKDHDWDQYAGKILLVYCSTDAIIPLWAYMLVAAYATPVVHDIFQGEADDFYRAYFLRQLDQLDTEPYRDQRLVIKGCSDHPVPAAAYLEITRRLQPVVKSIMYGEPCSTVPVYKQPR